MEEALTFFRNHLMKPYHILARIWTPLVIMGHIEVLRCSDKHAFGPYISNNQFMMKVFSTYMLDSLSKVFFIAGESGSFNKLEDELVPHISTTKNFTSLLNKWLPVSAYRNGRTHCALNLHVVMSGGSQQRASHGQKNMTYRTLALPVFDGSSNTCVGVFELVIGSPDLHYAVEALEEICNLFQGVNLRADTGLRIQPRQIVFAEIMNVLREVCERHSLPLAQTWLPCMCGDTSSQADHKICMSNAEIPFYMRDSTLFAFWRANSGRHLFKGQGVAGKAFLKESSCFCKDITLLPENEFSLPKISRKLEIEGSLAICLRSSHSGTDLYIVQFFLASHLRYVKELEIGVKSIPWTMTQHFVSLSLVSSEFYEMDPRSGDILDQKKLLTFSSNPCIGHENMSNASLIPPEEASTSKTKKKKVHLASFQDLKPYLAGTLRDAATALGMSQSTLKRQCRRLQVDDWKEGQKTAGFFPVKRKRSHKHEPYVD